MKYTERPRFYHQNWHRLRSELEQQDPEIESLEDDLLLEDLKNEEPDLWEYHDTPEEETEEEDEEE